MNMTFSRPTSVIVLLSWIVLVVAPVPICAQLAGGEFLVISDVHFDPFFDGALFAQLDAQPIENWAEILGKSQPGSFSPMGTDSNYALLKSSLDDAQRRIPAPDFLLYPGDFLAHNWQSKYDQLAKASHLADAKSYRAFTSKVVRFLAGEFRKRYLDTPILPTLGNDDSYCGDYMITPDGSFLEMFAEKWAPLLGSEADRDAFRATFTRGGHYSLKLTRARNHRLIVLNTVFFSTLYDNACGKSDQTPALDQLNWLGKALQNARTAGEQVWLLMHIPPGLNGYQTAESVKEGGPAVTFWQPELTSRFLQLVGEYRSMIQAVFTGHTHMDDFRVIILDGQPALFIKIVPAVSPIYGNNPSFQVYQYDRDSGAIQNYQTYFLTNLASSGQGASPPAGHWAMEYDFRQAYGFSALNPATVAALAGRIATDPEVGRRYIAFYSVSAAPEITAATLGVYRCVIPSVTPAEFQLCNRGVPVPMRSPPLAGRKVTVRPAQPK